VVHRHYLGNEFEVRFRIVVNQQCWKGLRSVYLLRDTGDKMLKNLVTLLAMGSMLLLLGCCHQETLATIHSPDKSMTATVSIRDCGATTSEYTSVTLKSNHGWSRLKRTVFSTKYENQVNVRWEGNSELIISCRGCKPDEVRAQETTFSSVNIACRFGVAALKEE
jgi:hypothetical protein